jgi:hypothetical protein
MAISSIDELLMGGGGNSLQPDTPEHKYQDEPEPIEELDPPTADPYEEPEVDEVHDDDPEDDLYDDEDDEPEERQSKDHKKKEVETDEYGNEREPENKEIRERLARQARKHQEEIDALRAQLAQQGASREVQQAAKDFEYDPDASGDWQQQLGAFIKQTVNSMTREQEEAQTRQREAQIQADFEAKFRDGMGRFDDFRDVISSLPCEISNPMTLATRAMENPAAFLYAAAKRHPQELERISKLRDPYAQMTEMGRLEERMRKNRPTTKAPRPLGRTPEDSHTATPKKKSEPNGDDLLARADAKRLATVKTRLRGNR